MTSNAVENIAQRLDRLALCKSLVLVTVATLLIQSLAQDTAPLLNGASEHTSSHYKSLIGLVECVSSGQDSSIDSSDSSSGVADQPDNSSDGANSYPVEENEDDPASNGSGQTGSGSALSDNGSPLLDTNPSLINNGEAASINSGGGAGNGGVAALEDDDLPNHHQHQHQHHHLTGLTRQRNNNAFVINRNHQNNADSNNDDNTDDYTNTATTSALLQTPMAATRQPISFFNAPQAPPMGLPVHHHHHMSAPAEMLNFFEHHSPFGPPPPNSGGQQAQNSADSPQSGLSASGAGPMSAMDEAVAVNGRHHQAAMNALFQRRQLSNQLQAGQELNPLALGVPGSPQPTPFNMFGGNAGPHQKQTSSNSLDNGLGPSLPFGLGPGLAGIPGFHTPFDGPQRGDQSAHSNVQTVDAGAGNGAGQGGAGGQPSLSASGAKVWPKIFRFTDGRINLSDFEKQKKIRLNSKNINNHLENQIDSSPVMFDGRPLRRKSFLILHGGIY